MTKASKDFFSVLLTMAILATCFGFYKIIVRENFQIFTTEDAIPKSTYDIFNI